MKSSNIALIVAIIALLSGGGLYLYDQKIDSNRSILLDDSGNSSNNVQSVQGNTPVPDKITLTPISGVEASGISNRVFANNKFILTINANLPKLGEEKSYKGWMQNGAEILSLGNLENDGDSYYLEYKSDTDMSKYRQIFVTPVDNAGNVAGERILEGQF